MYQSACGIVSILQQQQQQLFQCCSCSHFYNRWFHNRLHSCLALMIFLPSCSSSLSPRCRACHIDVSVRGKYLILPLKKNHRKLIIWGKNISFPEGQSLYWLFHDIQIANQTQQSLFFLCLNIHMYIHVCR